MNVKRTSFNGSCLLLVYTMICFIGFATVSTDAISNTENNLPCHLSEPLSDQSAEVAEGFLPVPVERAKELVVDAMFTADFMVQKEEGSELTARRGTGGNPGYAPQRGLVIKKNGKKYLGSGGELLYVSITPTIDDGVEGANIVLRTKKTQLVMKDRQGYWGNAILEKAECLYNLLDSETAEYENIESSNYVTLKKGTQIKMLLRRSISSGIAKTRQEIMFQSAEDVFIDDQLVIRKGQIAQGEVTGSHKGRTTHGWWMISHVGGELFIRAKSIIAVDGTLIPLKYDPKGIATDEKTANRIRLGAILFVETSAGEEVGFLAGFELSASVDGDICVFNND